MRLRLATACIALALSACEIPVPVPGPVTTAGQAIQIAQYVCSKTSDDGKRILHLRYWSARLIDDKWKADYSRFPEQPLDSSVEMIVMVSAKDGSASQCYEQISLQ